MPEDFDVYCARKAEERELAKFDAWCERKALERHRRYMAARAERATGGPSDDGGADHTTTAPATPVSPHEAFRGTEGYEEDRF